MPEKIVLEDGTEKEILTDDEVKDLKAGHDANKDKRPIVEQHNKFVESLELKEGQTIEQKLEELKEAENPNWQKMRSTLKVLREAAKDKGIEVDEEGNVVEKKETLTKEEVEKIAEDTNTKAQKQQQKDKALEGFSKEDAETIGKTFDKFDSVGGTFEENMQMAIEKVLPGQGENLLKDAINSPGGAHPNKPNKKEPSSELKSFGADKFGLKEEDYENANK